MDVSTVIWCTGFRPDFGWIDLPVFDEDGGLVHDRGVVSSQPGLYFMGLFFLSAFTSSLIGGVGRGAQHIAKHIASHEPHGQVAAQVLAGARRSGAPDRARTGGAEA